MILDSITQLPKAVQTLTEYPNWVCWTYSLNEQGKPTKPPLNPISRDLAKSNDPKTWSTYEQAINTQKQYDLEGVGFMFYPPSINLVGIDIDHCIDDEGNMSDLALDVIDLMPGYWEISPSGKGLHALVLGKIPGDKRKQPKMGFEMYESGRYFTVTGNQLSGSVDELVDCSKELGDLYAMIFGNGAPITQATTAKAKAHAPNVSEQDILNKAMNNPKSGPKFRALWGGDFSGYRSQSEADFALINSLAYWSDHDDSVMDSLFRQSGLMREKWDKVHGDNGVTYGQITIEKALSGSHRFTPGHGVNRTNGHGANGFEQNEDAHGDKLLTLKVNDKTNDEPLGEQNSPNVLSREQPVNTVVKKGLSLTSEEIAYLLYEQNASDEGNAQCVINWYAKTHGGQFLHTYHYGWLYWTGTHWESEDAEMKVQKAVLDTVMARLLAATFEHNPQLVKAFKPTAANINSTVALLKILCNANVNEFDRDPDKLNVLNGVIDLRTGQLLAHDPLQRFTYCVQTAYNAKADFTAWKNHLYTTFVPENMLIDDNGKKEINRDFGKDVPRYLDLLNYIQMSLGYSLTGQTNEEMMFYIQGKTRSGKDTLLQGVRELLGKPLAAGIPFSTLTKKRDSDSEQNFDLARLKPCHFLVASESAKGSKAMINGEVLKTITSYKNTINAAFKGKNGFEFVAKFKIWVSSNNNIVAHADDDALWQRLIIIHTANSFAGREDTRLKDRLTSKESLEGLLALLVKGAMKWYVWFDQGKKMPTPQLVSQTTQASRDENDTLGMFISECCVVSDGEKVIGTELMAKYKEWCLEYNYMPKGGKSFSDALRAKGFMYGNARFDTIVGTKKSWHGLSLDTAKLEY